MGLQGRDNLLQFLQITMRFGTGFQPGTLPISIYPETVSPVTQNTGFQSNH